MFVFFNIVINRKIDQNLLVEAVLDLGTRRLVADFCLAK